MKSLKKFLFFLFAVLLLNNCAGGGAGDKAKSKASKSTKFRQTLGLCLKDNLLFVVDRVVFTKHAFLQGDRFLDAGKQLYVDTAWKSRKAFEDERAMGIVAVESRIYLKARQRGHIAQHYKADFYGETRVLYAHDGNWQSGPMTKQASHFFRDLADEIRQKLAPPDRF